MHARRIGLSSPIYRRCQERNDRGKPLSGSLQRGPRSPLGDDQSRTRKGGAQGAFPSPHSPIRLTKKSPPAPFWSGVEYLN